jgi:hypothetical protein
MHSDHLSRFPSPPGNRPARYPATTPRHRSTTALRLDSVPAADGYASPTPCARVSDRVSVVRCAALYMRSLLGHAPAARALGMRRRVSFLSQCRRKALMRMACLNPMQIMTGRSRRDRGVSAPAEAHPADPPTGGLAVPSSGFSAKTGWLPHSLSERR